MYKTNRDSTALMKNRWGGEQLCGNGNLHGQLFGSLLDTSLESLGFYKTVWPHFINKHIDVLNFMSSQLLWMSQLYSVPLSLTLSGISAVFSVILFISSIF